MFCFNPVYSNSAGQPHWPQLSHNHSQTHTLVLAQMTTLGLGTHLHHEHCVISLDTCAWGLHTLASSAHCFTFRYLLLGLAHICIFSAVLFPQILALGLCTHLHHEHCATSSGVFHKLLLMHILGLGVKACSGLLKHSPSASHFRGPCQQGCFGLLTPLCLGCKTCIAGCGSKELCRTAPI